MRLFLGFLCRELQGSSLELQDFSTRKDLRKMYSKEMELVHAIGGMQHSPEGFARIPGR